MAATADVPTAAERHEYYAAALLHAFGGVLPLRTMAQLIAAGDELGARTAEHFVRRLLDTRRADKVSLVGARLASGARIALPEGVGDLVVGTPKLGEWLRDRCNLGTERLGITARSGIDVLLGRATIAAELLAQVAKGRTLLLGVDFLSAVTQWAETERPFELARHHLLTAKGRAHVARAACAESRLVGLGEPESPAARGLARGPARPPIILMDAAWTNTKKAGAWSASLNWVPGLVWVLTSGRAADRRALEAALLKHRLYQPQSAKPQHLHRMEVLPSPDTRVWRDRWDELHVAIPRIERSRLLGMLHTAYAVRSTPSV